HDVAATRVSALSLHDALPIWATCWSQAGIEDPIRQSASVVGALTTATSRTGSSAYPCAFRCSFATAIARRWSLRKRTSKPRQRRSEEHTSELQSRENLVCRLL